MSKIRTNVTYKTTDGCSFYSLEEARLHQEVIEKIDLGGMDNLPEVSKDKWEDFVQRAKKRLRPK